MRGLLTLATFILCACSDSGHQVDRLGGFGPITFAGKTSFTASTGVYSSKIIQANCHRTTTSILVSKDQVSWEEFSLSGVIDSCRTKGYFRVDLLANNVLKFTKGVSDSKKLYFVARSGQAEAPPAALTLNYNPTDATKSPPGLSVGSTSGVVVHGTSGTRMKYKLAKPIGSVISGATYKIKPVYTK